MLFKPGNGAVAAAARKQPGGEKSPHHFAYRPEIDGLRAVAVIPVILYHAGFVWFGGGYVGVDVFFVISGYLITSIIYNEKSRDSFTIRGFYERRARRILPALFFVMFVCAVPAWFWMTPDQLKELSETLVAVSFFASNILFWLLTSAYFGTTSLEKPLIHTWSLGVEEQFYLLFPLVIILFWSLGRRRLASIIGVIGLISFAIAQYGSHSAPLANYFLAPSRAWELMIGACIAIASLNTPLHDRIGKSKSEILAALGAAMIAIPVFFYGKATPFPGVYALLPTVGTGLIIAFAGKDTFVGKALSVRWIVGLGLISYSAYLWHQPLFAYARIYSFNELSSAVLIMLSVLAIALAWLSWRFVEKPFRDRGRISRRQVFTAAGMATSIAVSLGVVGYSAKGFPQRFSKAELAAIEPSRTALIHCHFVPVDNHPNITQCPIGSPGVTPSVVLLGDSHITAIGDVLGGELKKENRAGLILRDWACPDIWGIFHGNNFSKSKIAQCRESNRELLRFITDQPQIKDVVLAERWTWHLYPVKGQIDSLVFDNGEGGVYGGHSHFESYAATANGALTQEADAKRAAVIEFLNDLAATGKTIIVQYPVPEVGWNIPERALKTIIRGEKLGTVSTSQSRYETRNAFVIGTLDSVNRPNIVRVRPSKVLCDTFIKNRCVAQLDGMPLYFDDDHLDNYGAALIVKEIMKAMD